MMPDYKATVRKFISDTFIISRDDATFKDSDSFMEAHIVDSTGFLELIMFLEETWGITVDDDEVIPENLDSLDGIERYLSRKLGS